MKMLILSNAFMRQLYDYFIFDSIILMQWSHWFANVRPPLHPRIKSNLIMVCDPFMSCWVWFVSICVKDFCININQGYWPIIFFSCCVLIQLCYQSNLALWNELEMFSYSTFWKALKRIGINSINIW